jgi:hypothetical protein
VSKSSKLVQGVKHGVRGLLRGMGYDIHRIPTSDTRYGKASHDTARALPRGAQAILRRTHPRLQELRAAYAAVDLPMAQRTRWDSDYLDRELDLTGFRGDNAFLWQFRNLGAEARLKYYFYLRDLASRDQRRLIETLGEDGAFGCWIFEYPGWPPVSRDLLDSVNELYFLQRHLGFLERAGWRVLDVGAGYGRLAHRALCAVPALGQYVCTDAVPESTFLCDYYLQFRGVRERADVVPLHQLERLAGRRYDLAVNIHSFSEMSHAAIDGWLARIAALGVPWLLVIPNNGEDFLTSEAELDAGGKRVRRPFDALFGANGYELAVNEPVFADVTMREFMCVTDHFFLFRRRGAS